MAYMCPRDLDGFLPHLNKPDTKFRQQLGTDLLSYLAEPSNPIQCQDIGLLVDGLIPWMQSSNYKVSSNGIDVMTFLVHRLGHDYRPYLSTVLPTVIDRLGDARDTVREKAQLLILKLLERNVLTPQSLLEKLTPGFSHKNAKIREEVLRCLVNILNEHTAQAISLNKFIPHIVKLLQDPTAPVRDTAFNTLVDLYKHVGEKLRVDLQRRNLVPTSRLPALIARFDEVREAGELLPTASTGLDLDREFDEPDRIGAKPIVPVKKAGLSQVKRSASSASRTGTMPPPSANSEVLKRYNSIRRSNTLGSGAVSEEVFINSFQDVPTVQLFSVRELTEHMNTIKDIISDVNKDWNKRTEALKKIRSLIVAGALNYPDEFYANLRVLESPLQVSVKDLRSQVVREVCITIAYLAYTCGNKFDHAAEFLLSSILNLIQNSAKIIATAGIITMRFILQYTHATRLIPIITNHLTTSKSKDIRRSCCEFLELILSLWSTHSIEKHHAILQESIKKGVADADPEARVSSRKAFKGFRDHFPDLAEALLQSLEPSYRRALQGELCLSSSSSSGSLAQTGTVSGGLRTPRTYRAPAAPQSATGSTTGSTENLCGGLQRAPSLPRTYRQRSGIPVLTTKDNSAKRTPGFRSNSAIDLQAAQRAKARAQYAAMARHKIASGTASLQGEVAQQARPRKSPEVASTQSPERMGRTRTRSSGVSQSQPTSRSGSPSSRLQYIYRAPDHDSPRPRRLSSGIPRSSTASRENSREASPTRGTPSLRTFRRGSDRPPLSPASRPVMAQKILQQSREAESALADALILDQMDSGEYHRLNSPRRTLRSFDNHSDDSETSSVCSERSFDSYRRPSDSFSWSGSQQRLARDLWEPCRDITEIIQLCASTVWQERKDGLVSLAFYLNNGHLLTAAELKRITEIFTKMFMDSHTKGHSVFLDTLNEVIRRHKADLHDWLYVLLQRIFHKLGSDLLSSTQNKMLNTLETIKRSFPQQLQFSCLYRFLMDNTQTPNAKVKVAVLTYLSQLCHVSDPSQFVVKHPANQALLKIINYSTDMKSIEVKNAAKMAIVALWNCNTPQVTMMLSELPKEAQDIAQQVVQSHLRKSSTGSEPGSPLVSMSPNNISPSTPNARLNDDFNQEEIYKSIRRTTAEIQNYSFDTSGTRLDRDTTSQDSGISQMSVDAKPDIITIEEKMEELNIRSNYATPRGQRSLPYSVNGITDTDSNGYGNGDHLKGDDVIHSVMEIFTNPEAALSDQKKALNEVWNLLKHGLVDEVKDPQNFKKLLRIFLSALAHSDPHIKITVLQILTEVFKNDQMKECWSGFVELLTLKVIEAHADPNKEVVKVAETTAAAISVVCPFDTVVKLLCPFIKTSPYPKILGAIKMLTKLVEQHPNEITDDHLADIMPGLVRANDHEESPVRKSAVFCMVALHKAVGEKRLEPHTVQLVGSKLKLLRLYIGRAQQGSSVPTSPKNSAS